MNLLITMRWAAREAALRWITITNGIPYPLEVQCGDVVEQFRHNTARKLLAVHMTIPPEIETMTISDAQQVIQHLVDQACWNDGYWGWFLAQGWHGNPAKVR